MVKNVQIQVNAIDNLMDLVNGLQRERNINMSEINQIKIEMEEFREFKDKLTNVNNVTTRNMEILSKNLT